MLDQSTGESKRCTSCGETKLLSTFTSDGANGRKAWCRACTAAYYRDYWKKRNAEGRKRVRTHEHQRRKCLKKKYGITLEQYNEMFTAQGGVCCICGQEESGNPYGVLEVEHEPGTKNVRGLVCHPCNNAVMWYENAAKYPYLDKVIAHVRRQQE